MRDSLTQYRARYLRNHTTRTEQYLWQHLRRRQLAGCRFRRQVPIGGYIADFACLEAKLVIELDGGQHADRRAYDEQRERRLQAEGFRVLRFWDNDVFQKTAAVLEVVLAALTATRPHPDLPAQAGEGSDTSTRPHPDLPPPAGEGS